MVVDSLVSLAGVTPGLIATVAVTSVADAILALDAVEVDLALIDVRMPGGSGLAVLRSLELRDERPRVVLMSTGPRPANLPKWVEFVSKHEVGQNLMVSWTCSPR